MMEVLDVQEALERIDQIEAVHCWAASVSGDAPLITNLGIGSKAVLVFRSCKGQLASVTITTV